MASRREEEPLRTGYASVARVPPQNARKRALSSKYDLHKVKVWLGDKRNHYYILSRFLISRSLTITKIPSTKAIKIALELKKHLVDRDKLSVSQDELEQTLFSLMREKGYGQAYIDCYRTVSKFYQLRQPLVIILCGAPCTGKSTISQQLAARLNMPNVMQTDVICELMRRGTGGALPPQPPWARCVDSNELRVTQGSETVTPAAAAATGNDDDFHAGADLWVSGHGRRQSTGSPGLLDAHSLGMAPSKCSISTAECSEGSTWGPATTADADKDKSVAKGQRPLGSCTLESWLLSKFQSECRLVRRALQGDFNKALQDGKPLIVEGCHLDPGQLLVELQELGIVILPVEAAPATPTSGQPSEQPSPQPQQQYAVGGSRGSQDSRAGRMTDVDLGEERSDSSGDFVRPRARMKSSLRSGGRVAEEKGVRAQHPSPFSDPLSGPRLLGTTAPAAAATAVEVALPVLQPLPTMRGEVSVSGCSQGEGTAIPCAPVVVRDGPEELPRHQSQPHLHQEEQQRLRSLRKHVSWSGHVWRSEDDGEGYGSGECVKERERMEQQEEQQEAQEQNKREQVVPEGDGGSNCRLRVRAHRAPEAHGSPATSSPAAPWRSAAELEEAAEADDERGEQESMGRYRWGGASSPGSASPLASSNNWDDGASDINNYGDADTDGAISRTSSTLDGASQSPRPQPATPPSTDLVPHDDDLLPIRRSQSHPIFVASARQAHGSEDELPDAEVLEGKLCLDVAAEVGLTGSGSQPCVLTSALPTGLSEGVSTTCTGLGVTTAASIAVTHLKLMDRAWTSKIMLSAAAGSRHSTGAATPFHNLHPHTGQPHLHPQSTPGGFNRNVSLSAMDMHTVRTSLTGILRMGSVNHVNHGSRLSPSPRLLKRLATTGRAVGSCGTSPNTASPSSLTRAFSKTTAAASTREPLLLPGGSPHPIQQHHQQSQSRKQKTQQWHEHATGLHSSRHVTSPQQQLRGSDQPQEQRLLTDQEAQPQQLDTPDSVLGKEMDGFGVRMGVVEPEPGAAAAATVAVVWSKGSPGGGVEDNVPTFPVGRAVELLTSTTLAAAAASVTDASTAASADATVALTSRVLETKAEVELVCIPTQTHLQKKPELEVETEPTARSVQPGDGLAVAGVVGGALPPLFVPIVLRMSETDHRLALEDNTAIYDRGGGGDSARATASGEGLFPLEGPEVPGPEEVLQRAQLIQQYLCSFESQGMPVVDVRYGNFGEALDVLHEYILLCIQAAMEQLNEGRVPSGDLAGGAATMGALGAAIETAVASAAP